MAMDFKSIGVIVGGVGAVAGLSLLSKFAKSRSLAEVAAGGGFLPNQPNADRNFAAAIYDLSDGVERSANLDHDRKLEDMAKLMRRAASELYERASFSG